MKNYPLESFFGGRPSFVFTPQRLIGRDNHHQITGLTNKKVANFRLCLPDSPKQLAFNQQFRNKFSETLFADEKYTHEHQS